MNTSATIKAPDKQREPSHAVRSLPSSQRLSALAQVESSELGQLLRSTKKAAERKAEREAAQQLAEMLRGIANRD